jgi:hypothetical protein
MPHARVKPAVEEIGEKIRQHNADGQEKEDSLEDRIVARL